MESLPTFRGTVIKAGGGVLKNFNMAILATLIKRLTELRRSEEMPILVVSAFRDVTNRLENVYRLALHKEDKMREAIAGLESIFTLHQEILNDLVPQSATHAFARDLNVLNAEAFGFLRQLSRKGSMLHQPSDDAERVKSGLLAIGEKFASLVVKTALSNRGFGVHLLHAESFMTGSTEEGARRYTDAIVDAEVTTRKLRDHLEEYMAFLTSGAVVSEVRAAVIPVVLIPGFIGVDENGDVVNFSREGSDLTAIHVVRAMNKQEVIYLKDVDPGKPLGSMNWYDLRTMQARTGSHLVGDTAIGTAIQYDVLGVIVDFETGKQYAISC